MITSGLMLMGGCFAQDAAGAAVDSYWAASHIEMPQVNGTDLISVPFPGGSSAADEIWGGGNFEWPDLGRFKMTLGVGSYYRGGKYIGGCGFRDVVVDGQLFFNGAMVDFPSGRYFFHAKNGQAEIIGTDARYELSAPEYALTMQECRTIKVLHSDILELEYLQYENTDTGVKWQLVPMRGVSGTSAIWETWTKTLTEL